MVTVSAVTWYGLWCPWTSPAGPDVASVFGGESGHITTYAQGAHVETYWRNGLQYRHGTSFAAPQVVSSLNVYEKED